MTKAKREALRIEIEAHALAGCDVSPEEIDRINILNASLPTMRRSVRALSVSGFHAHRWQPVSNGGRPPGIRMLRQGDARFASIAAASVLAKPPGCLHAGSAQPSRSMGGMPMRAIRRATPLGHSGARDNAPSPFVVPSVARADGMFALNNKGIVTVTCNCLRTVELRMLFYPHNAVVEFSSLRNHFNQNSRHAFT